MKLKNTTIIALVNNGLLNTTEHDVPAADAYKAYKFRRAVEKAFNAIAEKDKELPAAAGVEKDKEPTGEQAKRIAELRTELYNDESDLGDNIIPMSWESFHVLANENKRVMMQVPTGETDDKGQPRFMPRQVDVFRACEGLLEGVLFKAAEEE